MNLESRELFEWGYSPYRRKGKSRRSGGFDNIRAVLF